MILEYDGVTPTIEQTFEELKEELKAGKTTIFFQKKPKLAY
ncbi:hypothetical protein [Bacillus coahuilensis]|nr:hypothetical protein [Bacillus coahuilensis]